VLKTQICVTRPQCVKQTSTGVSFKKGKQKNKCNHLINSVY
jgi:hypothetical protein